MLHDMRLEKFQHVFFTYLKYGDLQTLEGKATRIDLHQADNILAITGIAHPEPMLAELGQYAKVKHMAFADHHNFSTHDITRIREAFAALPGSNNIIVTTEKDAVRLGGHCDGLPVYVLPITVAFHKENDKDFDTLIESSVRENVSFLSKLSIWD